MSEDPETQYLNMLNAAVDLLWDERQPETNAVLVLLLDDGEVARACAKGLTLEEQGKALVAVMGALGRIKRL